MKKTAVILFLIGLFIACGGQSPMDNARVTSGGKTLQAPKTAKSNLIAAHLLTPHRIAKAFEIDQGLIQPSAAKKRDERCSYVWPKPNKEEIDKANQTWMMEYTKMMVEAQRKGEKPPKIKVIKSDASIFFNYMALTETGQAEAAFQNNIKNLKEGITVETKGHKGTIQIDYDEVIEGLGNQAAWSNSRRQLAVQHDRYLFYLNVDTQEKAEDELPYAKSLMADIVKQI